MKIKKINVNKTTTTETTRASGGIGGSYVSSQVESSNMDLSQYALKTENKFTQGDGFNSVIEKDHFLQANNDYETAVGKYNQSVADETIFTVGNGTDENDRKNAFAVTTNGDATVANGITANSVSATTVNSDSANITNIASDEIINDGIIKSQSFSGVSGTIQSLNTDNIVNSETIKTKNLEVTGSAHFFELIIDKIKSLGGAVMLTPADGFEVEKIKPMANNIKLYWRCQDGNGKQRDNMWKVNDQALCMSFNRATVGTSHNVANKYYWCLVTDVSDNNNPIEIDGELYNYISISRYDSVGTVEPEIGDSIVMCGYRGTDDAARQSAIYMSAYQSLDAGLTAPLYAQYQGINDFDLESHRKSYYDANSAKFIGEFEAADGQNIIDIINNKITESEASIKLNTKNIVLSVSEKTQERRNLLKGTTFHKKLDDFYLSENTRIEMNSGYKGTNCIHVYDTTEAGNPHYVGVYWDGSQGGRSIKIEKGKKYTLSCYYKTNDINTEFYIEAIYTDKQKNATRLGQVNYLSPNSFKVKKTNEWELFTTVIDTTNAESDYIAFKFWEGCNVNVGQIEAYISRPMVEEGDTYYGWTLSNEDYEYIGANLLDNSRTFDVGGNITLVKGTKRLVGDVYELLTSLGTDDNTFYKIDIKALKLNTDYTMSFEIVSGTADYLGVYAYYPAIKYSRQFDFENQNSLMITQHTEINVENHCVLLEEKNLSYRHKVWVHFKFKTVLPQYIYLNFPKNQKPNAYTYTRTVRISKPKLEEGANVTEWVEKKTDIPNKITTVTNNVSKLTQKADSIEANVTSNTTNINNINGQVTSLQSDMSDVKQTASSITSTVSSMKNEIIGENCMLGLNGSGWSRNTVYDDAGNSFHCESTDWFQSHPICDYGGDYTFSFGFWNGSMQIRILEFSQTYYDDGTYNYDVDFKTYTPCTILTTSSSATNDSLTSYGTSGTSSTWTYTNTDTISLKVGDYVAVRLTNSTNGHYNSIYGTVTAINTSSKSVTVKAVALLDQPRTICDVTCTSGVVDGTDINKLHYDEKLGRYWIRFKESTGAAKTFVMRFRNLDSSNPSYISRLMLEEGVERPHKYNSSSQASQSMIKQTAESIMMSVNDTYVRIGDGNITLNGDTKVNGSLTLTQTEQGFKLVGSDGVTEIMPKSIGTYDDFKSANTGTHNVIKTVNCGGSQATDDRSILVFEGGCIIYLGNRKKGDYIKVNFNTLIANVTNAWNGSTFSKSFALGGHFSAKIMNQYNSAVLHNLGTISTNREYSYTFDSDATNARIYVTFNGNTQYSYWIGNYGNQGARPMPMPQATFEVYCTLSLPTAAHMLIGYDGWGANFGNNKIVYCGKEGLIAKYGDTEFKITSDGISHNNMATTYTITGTSSSSSPATYTVQDPIDTIVCMSGYCKIIFPSNPYNGQQIKVFDKSPQETYMNTNGKYVCEANRNYNQRTKWTNQGMPNTGVRTYIYITDTWYEEFAG